MEMPDELLARLWSELDWKAAESKLADLQAKLSLASYRQDKDDVKRLQKKIVRDPDIKCLAVKYVVENSTAPGIDGVRWRTPAEKMKAALSLSSKNYRATPLLQISIIDKKGKERHPNLPTFYDRAMNVLYAFSLIPVTEAFADRKSFAYRKGRSTQDAHAYVLAALKGENAPPIIVYTDIKGCYANIQHSWILKHTPMDKHVLSEMLRAGIVFAGELFPTEEQGISEGANLSPHIANFVLDGLQKHIFRALYGDRDPDDYSDGNMIRFADDIIVTVRSRDKAAVVLEAIKDYIAVRGLSISEEKTTISDINEGFTFMSRIYIRKNGIIYCYPSDEAVSRFTSELRELILTNTKSQRELIKALNSRLRGWAEYHRYSDAEKAFREVDAAVQTALLEAAMKLHPKMDLKRLQAKYWYKEPSGRYCYALKDDKSVRVIFLSDTVLLHREKMATYINPFLDADYVEKRTNERKIEHISGPYRAVWKRQGGRCYYCGRPILTDQPRATVTLDLSRPPSVKNSAYIHQICALNEYEIIRTDKDISYLRPFDVLSILDGIAQAPSHAGKEKPPISENWKYRRLKTYFAKCTASSVTLTFREIEKIAKLKLPEAANRKQWWYPRKEYNRIAEAWISEGYSMKKLNLEAKRITFHRDSSDTGKLKIPDVLLNGVLPYDAIDELEQHMKYVIDKYALK